MSSCLATTTTLKYTDPPLPSSEVTSLNVQRQPDPCCLPDIVRPTPSNPPSRDCAGPHSADPHHPLAPADSPALPRTPTLRVCVCGCGCVGRDLIDTQANRQLPRHPPHLPALPPPLSSDFPLSPVLAWLVLCLGPWIDTPPPPRPPLPPSPPLSSPLPLRTHIGVMPKDTQSPKHPPVACVL